MSRSLSSPCTIASTRSSASAQGRDDAHTMYYKEEVKEVESFGAPDVEIKEAELKVAHSLRGTRGRMGSRQISDNVSGRI